MGAPAVVGEIIGTVVVDGAKYLLKKVVDGAGSFLWQLFTDEDEDGVPDDPENPWDTWDKEPDEWTPFPENPPTETSDPTQNIGNVVVITPDGPLVFYDGGNNSDYETLVSQATEQWVNTNGATNKLFKNYSVTEALLFIIAACALFFFFKNIFKRRKL